MNHSPRPILALLTMSILWGYSWTILKMGLLDADPFTFTALRIGTGAGALLVILPLTGRPWRPTRIPELLRLGMVQSAALFTFSTWAIYHGNAGRVAFLTYTMPFFTLLMAWPILGERVKGLQWLAIFFAATGLVAIVQPWNLDNTPLSNALAIAAGAAWGLGAIMVKRMQNRAPMDLIAMTAWQMFFGLIPLIVAAVLTPNAYVEWTPRFIGVVLFIGVISTACGWLLWVYALNNLEAGTASLGTLLAPVIAMASSAYHFGERPNGVEYLGMGAIIAALLTLSFIAIRATTRATPQESTPLSSE
ncbi:MAG: DMT family transporter [Pseudomonadota bacterium]